MFLKDRLPSSAAGEEPLPKWTWLVSLLLLFHLAVILITPNTQNYFGFRLGNLIKPYIGLFEFTAQWTFFSPDPAAPMYYEWKIYDNSGSEIRHGVFPDVQSVGVFADRDLRRLAAARYMSMREGTAQKTLIPYLCRVNPGAASVRLTRVVILPTPLIDIIQGKKGVHDRSGRTDIDVGMEFCDSQSAQSST